MTQPVHGEFVDVDEDRYYRISGVDQLSPFMVTLTSSSDLWAFITSNGGITAGRRNAESAIFPYFTEDKLSDLSASTGGHTELWVSDADGNRQWWRPFAELSPSSLAVQRSMLKTVLGDVVMFEETREDLGITVRVRWRMSPSYGLVRSVSLHFADSADGRVDVLDGVRNVLPAGVTTRTQRELSNLLDAYKATELDTATGLAWVRLNSRLTDRAEASESLETTTMWQVGATVDEYRIGEGSNEHLIDGIRQSRGGRADYLISTSMEVVPGGRAGWSIVLDVEQDITDIVELQQKLGDPARLENELETDIARGREDLRALVASSDGLQRTGSEVVDAHHASSTMFNIMRGGVPANAHQVDLGDVRRFIAERNSQLAERWTEQLADLAQVMDVSELKAAVTDLGDPDLSRIVGEYLPLTFSRRHGDPSRPWNKFNIVLTDDQGRERLDYQGNWRDIFQNWEALAWSFPDYVESMVRIFVNATTVDGYNPYRISRAGIDWEVPDEEDPWSNIGYWSDHQIIYLLKLLELSWAQHPLRLRRMLNAEQFVHADVPYRIADYQDLLRDPRNTVTFEEEHQQRIEDRVAELGGDGRLLSDGSGNLVRATLMEKLLILLGAKMANFVPDGGIWMNTQRPEWNDANNALVGSGLSMVTVGQVHRYVEFLEMVLDTSGIEEFTIPTELADQLHTVADALADTPVGGEPVSAQLRRSILDALGQAGEQYRNQARTAHDVQRVTWTSDELLSLLRVIRIWLAHSIAAARRPDGLYDSYNILTLGDGTAEVSRLPLMLEGQVSILSSGALELPQAAELLQKLPASSLYREDQASYHLYPEPDVPVFTQRNTLPARASQIALVAELLDRDDRRLAVPDEHGALHFASPIRNGEDVEAILDRLAADDGLRSLVEQDRAAVLDTFEAVFHHSEFTGRSSSFFAYEGIGSIYWHMVSKLLLAARENVQWAHDGEADEPLIRQLEDSYAAIRAGLGFCKTPDEFGAFPLDPYSHTPAGRGAQQPGMTGQAKEDVLARFGEVGVQPGEGQLHFSPESVADEEWLRESVSFEYLDVHQQPQSIELDENSLGFTLCQVPIIYRRGGNRSVQVHRSDGTVDQLPAGALPLDVSQAIFSRNGNVQRIVVTTNP